MSGLSAEKITALKDEFDEYGYIVIRDLIEAAAARRVGARLKEIMLQTCDTGRPEVHMRGLFNYLEPEDDARFAPLVTHPICMELARLTLGDGFQMAEVGARWRRPGAPELPLHVGAPFDHFARNRLPRPPGCFVLTYSWLLDDMTIENGARRFMPFSHHWSRMPRADVSYHGLETVEAPAGSLILFNSAVWHAIDENKSANPDRLELASGYCMGWMSPANLGWKPIKPSVIERLPASIRGMNRHAPEA